MNQSLEPVGRRKALAFVLFLLGCVVVAYTPAYDAGYIWDDDDYVTENETLQSAHGLGQIWLDPSATPQYYPLVHTTYWFEHSVWGTNPRGYHVINVLLHAVAALLLWRLLAYLKVPFGWLGALLFALHPVQVESVAWITERKNTLSAVFYLLSALSLLPFLLQEDGDRSRQVRRYVLGFLFFVAALLSKTVTCSLPAALLLVLWWRQGSIRARQVAWLVPLFAVGLGLGLTTAWLETHHVGASGPEWDLSFAARCIIASKGVLFYAGKLLAPIDLSFIYTRWKIDPTQWTQWIYPVAFVSLLLFLWTQRRGRLKPALVVLLLFAGTLLPALGFINVYPMRFSFVADHFQYLASMAPLALLGAVLGLLSARLGQRVQWAEALPLLVVVAGLGVLTWNRCQVYENAETLWRDTIDKNPACWMAHNNLGLVLKDDGRTEEAMASFQEALRYNPEQALPHTNVGRMLSDRGEFSLAFPHLYEAVRLEPRFSGAHNNLGVALGRTGQFAEAEASILTAIQLDPDDPGPYTNLATVYVPQGKRRRAVAALEESLARDASNPHAANNLAWLLSENPAAPYHDSARALELAQQACSLTSNSNPTFLGTLATAQAAAGDRSGAVATMDQAIRLLDSNGQAKAAADYRKKKAAIQRR